VVTATAGTTQAGNSGDGNSGDGNSADDREGKKASSRAWSEGKTRFRALMSKSFINLDAQQEVCNDDQGKPTKCTYSAIPAKYEEQELMRADFSFDNRAPGFAYKVRIATINVWSIADAALP
jgi:hypothetical protein